MDLRYLRSSMERIKRLTGLGWDKNAGRAKNDS